MEAFREKGIVSHACQTANVDRRIVYSWRAEDLQFRSAWDDALEIATDRVENTLYDLAASGKNVVATIFYLKGNRLKYRDRLSVDFNAMQGEIEQRLSEMGQADSRSIIVRNDR